MLIILHTHLDNKRNDNFSSFLWTSAAVDMQAQISLLFSERHKRHYSGDKNSLKILEKSFIFLALHVL